MSKHNVKIRRGRKEIHRDQGIVERFNTTLTERSFGYQYEKEIQTQKRNREWVKRLPDVIKALDKEIKKPLPFITKKIETQICLSATVRYLYQAREQEGSGKRRATDPIWNVDMHKIDYHIVT